MGEKKDMTPEKIRENAFEALKEKTKIPKDQLRTFVDSANPHHLNLLANGKYNSWAATGFGVRGAERSKALIRRAGQNLENALHLLILVAINGKKEEVQKKADIALGHETGELKESLEHVRKNPSEFIEAVKAIRELDPKTREGRQQEKEILKSYDDEIKEMRRRGRCPFSDKND